MEVHHEEEVLRCSKTPQTKLERPNDFPAATSHGAVVQNGTGKIHHGSDSMQSRRSQRMSDTQQNGKAMATTIASRISPLDQLSNEEGANITTSSQENQLSASTGDPRQRPIVTQQISTPGAIAVYRHGHARYDEEEDSTEYTFHRPTVPDLEESDAGAPCRSVRELHALPSVSEERLPDVTHSFWAKHWKKWIITLFLIIGTVVGIAVAILAQGGGHSPSTGKTPPPTTPPTQAPQSSLAPTASAWDILGTPISTGGQNGSFVSLSGNALVIAVSEDGMIGVFGYQPVSRNWTRLGQPLEGSAAHINFNGSIIVVQKESSANVTVLGFEFDLWRRIGNEIVASGIVNCVAIAGNGLVVAVGYDHIIDTFMIDDYGLWQPLGATIVDSFSNVSVRELSLSSDGTVMAAGFIDNPTPPFSHIWIFRDNTWIQGLVGYFQEEYLPGGQVSVSGDGSAFAVGDYGVIKWRQLINDRFPVAENNQIQRFDDQYETMVSLSSDGSVMAAASDMDVSVWELIGSEWEQVGLFSVEGPVQSVSLSDDGSVVAVGIVGSNFNAMVYRHGI